ncbi:MAG: protein translocase subunit SecF [Candidatus Colwellbacteria bacterium]|nr:protein translocase subunit SecF [Candidatus Colwellbacteria bacterium]
MIDVVRYKKIFLSLSAILVLAAIVGILAFGLRPGVDFTGGSLWQIKFSEIVSKTDIRDFFETQINLPPTSLSYDQTSGVYSLVLREIPDAERQSAFSAIKEKLDPEAEEQDFWSISPSVSREIKDKAMQAIVFVIVGISLFVAYAFRHASKAIKSWKYGVVTLITLAHDVVIPIGAFAIIGYYMDLTIDTTFVVALLLIMGFSVHDTIVVFDRIRESIIKTRHIEMGTIVNKSINETLKRSINTSFTLVLVLLALLFLGPASLRYFMLIMLIGTVVGTYSSIFVASPILTLFRRS